MTAEALTAAPPSGRVRIMTTSQAAVRGLDWGANVVEEVEVRD